MQKTSEATTIYIASNYKQNHNLLYLPYRTGIIILYKITDYPVQGNQLSCTP